MFVAIRIEPTSEFVKSTKKLDKVLKLKLRKQIEKIVTNPDTGKPLRHLRGERTLYVKPFRIIYSYNKLEDILYLLKFEHRDSVYQ